MEADPLAPLLFAIKLGLNGSVLLAAGLALHASLHIIAREGRSRALRSAAAAGAVAVLFTALRLMLANAQLGGVDALLDPATLAWTWPQLGPSSMAVVGGAVALLAGWLLRSEGAAGLGAIALAASFGLSGHTQALEAPGLAPWSVTLHVLIAAFWFAAPVTLWPTRHLDDTKLIARVTRFSDVAAAAIPLLFALGLWLAWRLAGGWTPLFTSLYGQFLLAKFGAAGVALALGAYNKMIVAKRLRASSETGRRALVTTLSLDTCLFLLALGAIAAATSLTGPPSH